MKIYSSVLPLLLSGVGVVGVEAREEPSEASSNSIPSTWPSAPPSSSPDWSTLSSFSDGESSPGNGFSKLDSTLQNLISRIGVQTQLKVPQGMLMQESGMLIVDVRGKSASTTELRSILEQELGFEVTGCFVLREGRCSVLLDARDLPSLAASNEIVSIQSNFVTANAGLVESEASQSMFADEARVRFDVDGTGIKVCVMSDSFNCAGLKGFTVTDAAQDVSTGDLPPFDRMDIVRDLEPGDRRFDFCFLDEGRAMMQLIHDIAPGADLGFYTAFLGFSAFAQGIVELVHSGCDIIVDNILYNSEAAFQDDLIAQAVDHAVDMGVAYFTSAGNRARNSWEGPYIETANSDLGLTQVMDFTNGQGGTVPFLRIRLSGLALTGVGQFVMQWDDRTVIQSGDLGPKTDLDFLVYQNGASVASSRNDNRRSGFTFEQVLLFADGVYDIVIERIEGPFPELVKIWFILGTVELDPINGDPSRLTAPTIYGHPNAGGAMTVGSAEYTDTPGFGFSPAVANFDTSAGGVPILFDGDGDRLDRAEIRTVPAFVGPDSTCTTFFGVPDLSDANCYRFGGTSASAPNVAGVAALMLQAQPRLRPEDIRDVLSYTADDMDDPFTPWFDYGYDLLTGYGFVDALYAVEEASLPLSKMKKGKKPKGKGKGGSSKSGKGKKNGGGGGEEEESRRLKEHVYDDEKNRHNHHLHNLSREHRHDNVMHLRRDLHERRTPRGSK